MHPLLRTLGALPLALAAILTLVWLMQTLISPRTQDTQQPPFAPKLVYVMEPATRATEVPQAVTEPPPPAEPRPEPPEPPEPLEPEPLPEPLELPLDPRPLDLPAVEQPPEPKPKPRAQPAIQPQPASPPRPRPQPAATPRPPAPKPAAPATFNRRPIAAPRPSYPATAKRRRIEGTVTVRFTVTRQGLVRDPQVIAAHPSGVFEQAALEAIRRWRFRPQAADFPGVTQKIRFSLRN
ncbi:Agglutinin receptor [Thiorhodovibrio winogradskyi]|uniref:Protein TonB n=1 Tax=Thiorhodovibrio winogradskyi TaxID=77007 RepID=A0ABZ0S9Z0_9GAMM|nr:energy transducer TonB [Thiorhodovibrio winogradskyi]